MTLHLVIATIPARRKFCEETLRLLSLQELLPDVVHVILDGYDDTDQIPAAPAKLNVFYTKNRGRRGGNCRWRYIDETLSELFVSVAVLDDDLTYLPKTYLQDLYTWVQQTPNAVFQYAKQPNINKTRISWFSGGISISPSNLWNGFSSDYVVQKYCYRGLSDDCLASAWAWRCGAEIYKQSHKETVKFADIPTSTGITTRARQWVAWDLHEMWAWPGPIDAYGDTRKLAPKAGIHVIISSVSWRAKTCDKLLQALRLQTVPPTQIHLILDQNRTTSPEIPDGLYLRVIEQKPGQRTATRWRILNEIPNSSFVLILDDDQIIPPDYIEKVRETLQHHLACTSESPVNPGGFSAHVEVIRALTDLPYADELLPLDDKLLLESHIYTTNLLVSKLPINITYHPESEDPRSLRHFRKTLPELIGLQRALRDKINFPEPPPPPPPPPVKRRK